MVTIESVPDFPSWAKLMGELDYDMSLDSVYNWGDPVIGVNRTYMSSNIAKGVWSNTQGYSNARVDELLDMDPRLHLFDAQREIEWQRGIAIGKGPLHALQRLRQLGRVKL